ncbi:uncharacterized protein LOC108210466 isoform X4 [Daucus carota subsp. sativus]|uniref:uncharacterized protein LOC108210466 isoform X4 n=1 Tax=Daucus carota subsp. sativus TaxID=79200 RepID=UPI0030832AD4
MSGGAPDFFYREAQRLGYVARSAFKLLQMQKQYKLITPGCSVLDLGCAPGAWLQKVKVPTLCDSRVQTISADVMNLPKDQIRKLSPLKGFSVILSDMCPIVSGISTRDAALSAELGMRALDLAVGGAALAPTRNTEIQSDSSSCSLEDDSVLKPGGNLIIKLLESEDNKEFSQICKPLFRKSSWLRPKATRSSSREIYLICQGLRRSRVAPYA